MAEVSPIMTQLAGLLGVSACSRRYRKGAGCSGSAWGSLGNFWEFLEGKNLRWTKSEEDGDNQAERSLGERCSLLGSLSGRASRSSDSEGDEENRVGGGTPEVDGTATEVGGEDPGEHDEDSLQCGGDQTQGESGGVLNASLCDWVSMCR